MMKWLSLVMVVSATAWGQESGSLRMRGETHKSGTMASFIRASLVGAADMQGKGGSAFSVQADVGRGMLGFETGFSYLVLPLEVTLKRIDDPKKSEKFDVTNTYYGLPLLLRYNYIEAPKNIFFVKAGLMFAFLQNGGGSLNPAVGEKRELVQPTSLREQENFGMISIGGTAPITNRFSLTVEGTYLRGLEPATDNGDINQGTFIGAGILFFL